MDFEVIIIGGSYAGLSAALALGRAKRKVLIVDWGKPCNRQTPYSHNLLTHDGDKPADIAVRAKAEVLKYPSVQFKENIVMAALKMENGFSVSLGNGEQYSGRKLLIATGLKDILPDIKGFAECWAISVIHCPYCHGYEVRDEKIALLMNGEHAFDMAKNLNHWNADLTLLTNGKSQLLSEQTENLTSKGIMIIEDEIQEIVHHNGQLKYVLFKNGKQIDFKAMYARPGIEQNHDLHTQLGYALTDFNTIKIDEQQMTTAEGVYAAGDCTTLMRSLSVITAAGTVAAVMMNKEMISADF